MSLKNNKTQRRSRITKVQKRKLLELGRQNGWSIARFKGAAFSQLRTRWWNKTTAILNAVPGGAWKTPKQWEKVFKDMRINFKKKRKTKKPKEENMQTDNIEISKEQLEEKMSELFQSNFFLVGENVVVGPEAGQTGATKSEPADEMPPQPPVETSPQVPEPEEPPARPKTRSVGTYVNKPLKQNGRNGRESGPYVGTRSKANANAKHKRKYIPLLPDTQINIDECSTFLKSKAIALHRIAKASEEIVEASRRNTNNLDKLVQVLTAAVEKRNAQTQNMQFFWS